MRLTKWLCWVMVCFPSYAWSEQAPATAPAPIAGWQDGFFVQSADGSNRLLFGLVAQADGRFSLDDPERNVDTFVMRKLRPTFSGRVARYFDFKFMPDFGNGTTTVADAYFDVRFSPKLRVRSGKDKAPVGYELLLGDAFLLFPERSLATSLVPNRDIGIQVQGDLNPKLYYAFGVFNGVPDGASADIDGNNGKDLAGRIVIHPFRTAGGTASTLNGFGFQLGGSTGKQTGTLPTFRTSVGQSYFSYATGATADGRRNRITPSVFYYQGQLSVFGEYVRSSQEASRANAGGTFTNTGWNFSAAYLLTGEAASPGIIRPLRPFDPQAGNWGALQLVVRYSVLDVDDDIFARGFAAAGASSEARQFTIGVNWHPASVFKYYFNYERTDFEPGAGPTRPVENILILRVQLGI